MKRRHKALAAVLILVLVSTVILLTSCAEEIASSSNSNSNVTAEEETTSEAQEEELVQVILKIPKSLSPKPTSSKSLGEAEDNSKVSYILFTATPKFSYDKDSPPQGMVKDRRIDVSGEDVELGSFAPGEWTFEVKGYNSSGVLIYQGTTETKLDASMGKPNVAMTVELPQETEEKGILRVEITVDDLRENGELAISCTNAKSKAVKTVHTSASEFTAEGDGTYYYSTEVSVIPGYYYVEIVAPSGVNQKVKAVVIDGSQGDKTLISGSLLKTDQQESSWYVYVSLDLKYTDSAKGKVLTEGTECTWAWDTEDRPKGEIEYLWFVDGEAQGDSDTEKFSLSKTTPGTYTVTCCVVSDDYVTYGITKITVTR